MTCDVCEDLGLVPFVQLQNSKPDEQITAEDLWFAVCLCERGRLLRQTRNAGKDTGIPLWQVWAAQHQVDLARVCRLEDAYSASDLAQAGFQVGGRAEAPSREAALLAGGRAPRKVKL